MSLHNLQDRLDRAEMTADGYAINVPGVGHVIAWGDGAPPSTAGIYAPNCLYIRTGGSTTTTRLYINAGTLASPSWTYFTSNA